MAKIYSQNGKNKSTNRLKHLEETNIYLGSSLDKSQELDPCDCITPQCKGCWYPCEKCGSSKCSTFCRVGRKAYDKLEWFRSN